MHFNLVYSCMSLFAQAYTGGDSMLATYCPQEEGGGLAVNRDKPNATGSLHLKPKWCHGEDTRSRLRPRFLNLESMTLVIIIFTTKQKLNYVV